MSNKSQFWSWSALEKLTLDTLQGEVVKLTDFQTVPKDKSNENSDQVMEVISGMEKETLLFPTETTEEEKIIHIDALGAVAESSTENIINKDLDSCDDSGIAYERKATLENLVVTQQRIIKSLTLSLNSAKLDLKTMADDVHNKTALLAVCDQSLVSARKELKLKQQEIQELSQLLTASRTSSSDLERECSLAKSEVLGLRLELSDREEQIEDLRANDVRLQDRIEDLGHSLQQMTASQLPRDDARTQASDETGILQRRVDALERNLATQRDMNLSMSEQCRSAQTELGRLSDMLRDSTLKSERLTKDLMVKDDRIAELMRDVERGRDRGATKDEARVRAMQVQQCDQDREKDVQRERQLAAAAHRQQLEELRAALLSAEALASQREGEVTRLRTLAVSLETSAQKQLEEYKRKTQTAVKEANSRAIEANQRADALEQRYEVERETTERELETERAAVNSLRSELLVAEEKMEELRVAMVAQQTSDRTDTAEGMRMAPSAATATATIEDTGADQDDEEMDSVSVSPPETELFYVSELKEQLHSLQVDLSVLTSEVGRYEKLLEEERADKRRLVSHVEDLTAFRSRMLLGDTAAVNKEYLKTCVLRFMATSDNSEKARLCPVIAALLDFTAAEKAAATDALAGHSSFLSLSSALRRSIAGL